MQIFEGFSGEDVSNHIFVYDLSDYFREIR